MANDAVILEHCGIQSIIVVTDAAMKSKSLLNLNQIYQENSIWLTYSVNSDIEMGVSSFFGYLFRNVRKNSLYGSYTSELLKNQHFVILALLQLSRIHAFPVSNWELFVGAQKTLNTDDENIFY